MDVKSLYQMEAKKFGIEEKKIATWWGSLNSKEKEGMKRIALAGMSGVALFAALEYEPDLLPFTMIPFNTYVNRNRFRKIAQKLHLVHNKNLKKVI